MLKIGLKRAFADDELDEQECGICGCGFEGESVNAQILEWDLGPACPPCLEHLSKRNPGEFPSVEELEEAKKRYPEPVYGSVNEVMALEEADDPAVHEAYRASWG